MNQGGEGNQNNQRINSNNLNNQQQILQIQHPSFEVSSSQPFSISQNNDLSQLQFQSFSQSQNQEPPKIYKKRGRKPKPKPTDQNLNIANNSQGLSPLMNTRTRSSSQNNSRNDNNDGGDGSEDENESESDSRGNDIDEGIPINAILCKTQFPFQPSIQNNPSSQNLNSNTISRASMASSRSSSSLSNPNDPIPNISHSTSVQNFDPNETQYLVKMAGQAPLHSFIVCEHSIKSGSQSGKLLNEFKKSCDYSNVKISSTGIEFLEPCSMDKIVNVDSFEIDQIISHRTFESETKFMEKLMGDNLHIPGLPTEGFLPNFEEIFKYSNSLTSNQNEAYLMLRDDGFFSYDENQGKSNQILKKELFHEVEQEEDQVTEKSNNIDNNENENKDESRTDSDFVIPEKIEFKIQWKNLPLSESSWESFESLMNLITLNNFSENDESRTDSNNSLYNKYLMNGSIIRQNLFCPTNMDELENIINIYWSRVVVLGEKTIPLSSNSLNSKDEALLIDSIPEEIPQMCRQTNLTDVQQDIIRKLFEYKINFSNSLSYDYASNGLCQVIQLKNAGRVFSIVGYLQMIYSIYHFTKPSLIIVNSNYAQIWKDALKAISSLFWIEFLGSSSDRMMLKHHRLDKKTRFDILITNCHILEKEGEFLKSLQWENIIIDDVHIRKDFADFRFLQKSQEDTSNIATRKRRGRKPKKINSTSVFGYSGTNDDYSSSKEDESENEEENENENLDEDESTKSESSSALDSTLISQSHSLSVLASNLLKNRNKYGSRSKKKNSSPFVILMNDIFSFAPIFNQMVPFEDIVPFHFQEIIFVVPNLINKFTYKKLSLLFKKRAARVLNMGKAVDVLHELVLSLQHPFIIPEIRNELFNEYVASRGLNRQRLSPSVEFEFLRSTCGKLQTLDELTIGTREKSLSITIVVAEDLAILKLLRLYFVMRRIPAGIVNTNVALERVPDDFAYGVLLMNREITHRIIDKFTISQIIFYDVSTSYKKDMDFVQFISRNQPSPQIAIYRLLTNHSIETELFIKTTVQPSPENPELDQDFPTFDYRDLSIRSAEPLIRAAVLSAKELEIEREDESFPSQSQFQLQFSFPSQKSNKASETVTSFPYEFPNGNKDLPSILNSVMDQTERDEFWAFAFQSSSSVKPVELTDFTNYTYDLEDESKESQDSQENQEKTEPGQQNEIAHLPEYRLYIELLKHGLNNWEKIAEKIDKPLEEVQKIGRIMVLKMLSNVKPEDIFRYTLISNIYWFEYSDEFASGHQLDEPEFWLRIAESKSKQINSPLFNNICFRVSSQGNIDSTTVFDGSIALRNLTYFEENYIIRSFLSIRKFPYIPTRLLTKKGIVIYTAEYIYSFLNFYVENTGDWESIKTKFRLNSYSTEAVIGYFKELYNAIISDVYSFVLHGAYSGERSNLIESNNLLWPLFQVFEQGPFTLNWIEPEIQLITEVILSFQVPLADQSIEDWCEFHSLTQLLTKSTESIEFMTSYIIEGISEIQDNQKFVIIPDLTQGEPITIPQNVVKKLKLRNAALFYIQKLSRMPKLIDFKPQADLPENWTVEDDQSIIKGICQFGYHRLFDLVNVNVDAYSEPENGRFCVVMNRDLSVFAPFLSEKSSLLMRLKLIITSNSEISQNKVNLINEQLSDSVNKVNVQHRRGRPPNPNKRKEQTSVPSSSIKQKSTSSKVLSLEQKPIESNDTEKPAVEEQPQPKVKKNHNLTQKQKRLDDETGFSLENENAEDDDDEDYGDYDSEENEFNHRLRSRPMATRARSSLDSNQNGGMRTRNQLKKQDKKDKSENRKQKKIENANDESFNEIEIKDEIQNENEVPQKEKAKKIKAKKVKVEEDEQELNENEETPQITQKKKQVKKQTQKVIPKKVQKFDDNEDEDEFDDNDDNDDEDEFKYSDEEEQVENDVDDSSIHMKTRSKSTSSTRKSQVIMKTRSQSEKQTPNRNTTKKSNEKETKTTPNKQIKKSKMEKKFRKISFIFNPLPEKINFTIE